MPSLNNYIARSQMELVDHRYHFVEQVKDKKRMSFLGAKIWNILSSNIKVAPTTASFTHSPKKEILKKLQ